MYKYIFDIPNITLSTIVKNNTDIKKQTIITNLKQLMMIIIVYIHLYALYY